MNATKIVIQGLNKEGNEWTSYLIDKIEEVLKAMLEIQRQKCLNIVSLLQHMVIANFEKLRNCVELVIDKIIGQTKIKTLKDLRFIQETHQLILNVLSLALDQELIGKIYTRCFSKQLETCATMKPSVHFEAFLISLLPQIEYFI